MTGRKTTEDPAGADYDIPNSYIGLHEIISSPPVEHTDNGILHRSTTLEEAKGDVHRASREQEREGQAASAGKVAGQDEDANWSGNDYNIPDNYGGLNELADASPVQNPDESQLYRNSYLEESRPYENEARMGREANQQPGVNSKKDVHNVSKLATETYTISYLILFAILGTLARVGLQALTFYPGAPVVFSELWANFGGSLIMGFLSEDRMLFKHEWGTPKYNDTIREAQERQQDEESGTTETTEVIDLAAAKKAYNSTKKTIPLYIGLATGFCGSFTSFSSFIRDAFFALSNHLPTPLDYPVDLSTASSASSTISRNGGYSFMALLTVIIITPCVCLSALFIGAHLAILLEPFTPSLPYRFTRKFVDRLTVFLAWGAWLGAIFLAIFPPDRNSSESETWRGRGVFAIVFAPIGCLGRFYASRYLNGKIASFPLGTFVVNMAGTAVLGMCYDLQHVPLGGVVGCQVLQGIEDGFCGCLTTVSTWVTELSALRRGHAYTYGTASVAVALCLLIVIMGSMQWTIGFGEVLCVVG